MVQVGEAWLQRHVNRLLSAVPRHAKVLQTGLQSEEHQLFVEQLQGRATAV